MTLDPINFYKCLADDTRLRALMLIFLEQELCVCELVEALQESQPKISRHLAQLRQCGLLTDRRQGQWVYYRINESLPEWAELVLQISTVENPSYTADDRARLHSMGDRPARMQSCCGE